MPTARTAMVRSACERLVIVFIRLLPLRYSARSSYSDQGKTHNGSMAKTRGLRSRRNSTAGVCFGRFVLLAPALECRCANGPGHPSIESQRQAILGNDRGPFGVQRVLSLRQFPVERIEPAGRHTDPAEK